MLFKQRHKGIDGGVTWFSSWRTSGKREQSDIVLLNQTWVHLRSVKLIYWHQVVVKGSTAFIEGQQARSLRQLVLKRLELPEGFQGKVYKDRWCWGIVRSVISFWTFFWWICAEVIGIQRHWPSGFTWSGVYLLVGST